METKTVLVGEVSVDAGLIWIGDPCYVLHKNDNNRYESIGTTWEDFCKILDVKDENNETNDGKIYNFDGLGVCISSGYGDGSYPVYAKLHNDRVKEIRIKFF